VDGNVPVEQGDQPRTEGTGSSALHATNPPPPRPGEAPEHRDSAPQGENNVFAGAAGGEWPAAVRGGEVFP
jgi:hypothetical protein